MPETTYALVTGASSGIGMEIAKGLAARKRNLVLVARSKEKLDALAVDLRAAHGILVESIEFDLSREGGAAWLYERLRGLGLKIDLLVNNAGFGAQGRFWELPAERQAQMIRLNVSALIELTYLFLPSLVADRRGAVMNVSSTASFQPVPYTSIYAATKAFVTSFSLGLAEELRPYGVTVVTLCPGGTDTNFFNAGQYGKREMPGGLQAAHEVAEAALRALDRGGGLVVPRLMNRAAIFAQRFIPRSWPIRVAARIFRV